MSNNYYKIILPLISKDYHAEKGYKYKGNAYIIYDKEKQKIVFNTLILDLNQIIIGGDGGRYASHYVIRKKSNLLFEMRKKSFNKHTKTGNKKPTKFIGSIEELNKIILENKLTIKDVVAFITGSNACGGLSKSENDPVRIFYEKDDLISIFFKNKLIEEFNKKNFKKIEWKFFSLLSNVSNKSQNNNFPHNKITKEFLDDDEIEEKPLSYLFDLNLKYIPYGKTNEIESHLPLEEAFVCQNIEFFNKKTKEESSFVAQSSKNIFKNSVEEIIDRIYNWSQIKPIEKILKNETRHVWKEIVNKNILKNKYSKDFIDEQRKYQRAHILSNENAVKKLYSNDCEKEVKRYLKDVFNEDNYLLLLKYTHNCWDEKKIKINSNGNIIKCEILNKEKFQIITKNNNNIYSVYTNVLDGERFRLLKKRELEESEF